MAALKAAGVDGLRVRLYAAEAAAHDWHAGREGSFRATNGTLRTARTARLPVTVTTPLTRSNTRVLAALPGLAADVGALGWQVSVVAAGRPQGHGALAPRLAVAVPYALQALVAAERAGLLAAIAGAPLCLLGPLRDRAVPSPVQAFAAGCSECGLRASCPGSTPSTCAASTPASWRPHGPARRARPGRAASAETSGHVLGAMARSLGGGVLADLTLPAPGSETARGLFSAALRRALNDLLRLPPGPGPNGAAWGRFVPELRRIAARAPGALASAVRRPTIGTLIRCLRGRPDPALQGELLATLALELAIGGVLEDRLQVPQPPREVLCLGARCALRPPPGPLTIGPTGWQAGGVSGPSGRTSGHVRPSMWQGTCMRASPGRSLWLCGATTTRWPSWRPTRTSRAAGSISPGSRCRPGWRGCGRVSASSRRTCRGCAPSSTSAWRWWCRSGTTASGTCRRLIRRRSGRST
ncbi:hypothetical protein [Nannocystis pusilla]|uniref:hypothetical protein n=1 Tax=Nannocystis pusilla TaxID=889268 RepID=UPI003B7DE9CE